jgi:hypothetical protein
MPRASVTSFSRNQTIAAAVPTAMSTSPPTPLTTGKRASSAELGDSPDTMPACPAPAGRARRPEPCLELRADEQEDRGEVEPVQRDRDDAQADHDMACRTGLCPALRTEVLLVPLPERRPVAPGQDRLKDAGSVPAACWTVTVTVISSWYVSSGLRSGNGRTSGRQRTSFWRWSAMARNTPPCVRTQLSSSPGRVIPPKARRTPCGACEGRLAAGRVAVP